MTDRDVTKEDRALAIVGIDSESHDQAAKTIRQLRSLIPNGKIVLIADANRPFDLPSVLALAPDGYVLNAGSQDKLVRSLELILMGQQILVLGRALTNGGDDTQFPERAWGSQSGSSYEFGKKTNGIQLSHRERQVLTCLAHGESNKEIARTCGISEATVKVHLKTILRKTNMRNRTQAAIWAIDHGLVGAGVAA
ncbi:MAG: response regulator transcription factor [Xanthobacteraceae bacterium]